MMPATTETVDRPLTKEERMRELLQHPLLVLRELNNRSLYHFMQYFWDAVCNHAFQPNWHIEYLCNELEQIAIQVGNKKTKLHDLIINIPPGSTKTLTCSVMFPAWCWTRWPWMRFITVSYSGVLSLESAEYCRDLIRSAKFQTMYPDIDIKDDKDVKSNYRITQKLPASPGRMARQVLGGGRYSTSVGGSLTGFHGDILIVDDPLNPEQAVSEIELHNANRWMEQTLPTRKTDKAVTPTILIMQRLHQDDPSGRILKKQKENLRHICIPGEIRNYGKQLQPSTLKRFYDDDLLDPIRMPWMVLKDLEQDLGQYGYAGQIGQDPTPPGGGMFKVDNLVVVDSVDMNHLTFVVRYWDKAGTVDAGAYSVGVKMGRLRTGNLIILDIQRGQWSAEVREQRIKTIAEVDGRETWIGIEQEPGSGGKESAENTVRNLMGFHVVTERPTGDKVFRADPFSVQVNNGNVLLMRGEWNHQYIEELRFFPFGTYKDQVDASSGAFNMLIKKRVARVLFNR